MTALRHLRAAAALAAVLFITLAGCDHNTDVAGPNLTDRFGDFNVLDTLTASRATVDFAAGQTVTFAARFNKQVNWVIEITGRRSGAVKRIEGFSNEITAENAVWEGRTTQLPLFRAEPVDAVLLIPAERFDTTRASVEVQVPRVYPGNVVADFESTAGITVGNFEFEFQNSGISTEVPAGQGTSFYLLRGTDRNVRNFFVGLIDLRPRGGTPYFPVPTSVPENLYFNMFIRGLGTDYTIAVVQLIADANGNGVFNDGVDTVLPFGDIPVNFTGWRLFSKPVSMIGAGLTQAQAQQIVGVRVLLISDNNAQPNPPLQVAYGIDYITFTAGGPLQL